MITRKDHKIPEKPSRNDYPSGDNGGHRWLIDVKIYQDHQIMILEHAINLLPSDIRETYIEVAERDYGKGLYYN